MTPNSDRIALGAQYLSKLGVARRAEAAAYLAHQTTLPGFDRVIAAPRSLIYAAAAADVAFVPSSRPHSKARSRSPSASGPPVAVTKKLRAARTE